MSAGCVAAGIGGTTYAVKASARGNYVQAAEAGDAEAQFKLGQSHCCMGPGFSTQRATEWLCRAAHQDHRRAQYELGRIYLGEVSRTPAPGQKILRAVTARSDPEVAFVWLTLASADGDEDAQGKLAKLTEKMPEAAVLSAHGKLADWREMPCEYHSVFPQGDETDQSQSEVDTGDVE
ncbi:MAG: sel1 repeat family protein [Alphaproteobacteria bacterium]|nr:MAG: sel1 repeat family protein [Alphaproteobacteria bacterium]